MSGKFGQVINPEVMTKLFLDGPGQYLVRKLLHQLSCTPPFQDLFGPYKGDEPMQRWADYQRFDWSVRQLPTINVFEAESEEKDSSHGYLNGSLSIQVFWPASLRRSDLTRVPSGFKSAIQNFFESDAITALLDPGAMIDKPDKVPGLNEFGRVISWQPNTAGMVEEEEVPVTLLTIRYKILLNSWYDYLGQVGRTKEKPFEKDLNPLKVAGIAYLGVTAENQSTTVYELDDSIPVQGG